MTDAPLEYLGGMTFGPAEGKPVISKMTPEKWLSRARHEFLMTRLAHLIYNFTDEEMEEWAREFGTPDEIDDHLAELVKHFYDWIDGYKAGIDVFETAAVRCFVIGDRNDELRRTIEAQQKPN